VRDDVYRELRQALEEERPVGLVTIVRGPGAGRQLLIRPDGRTTGSLDSRQLEERAGELSRNPRERAGGDRVEVPTDCGDIDLFVETFAPRPKLVIVGAVHIAIPLVRMARLIGFRTLVVDPRSAFATPDRFADADELISGWPEEVLGEGRLHEACYVAVLTHDLKIDVPALKLAVRSPAGYVGVLGSRKTHARRVEKLLEAGLSDEEIARIRAPIGLDLGGRSPEEIAVAILAEIVATRHGADPGSAR